MKNDTFDVDESVDIPELRRRIKEYEGAIISSAEDVYILSRDLARAKTYHDKLLARSKRLKDRLKELKGDKNV